MHDFYFYVAKLEVDIEDYNLNIVRRSNYSIHAMYSIGPHQVLNWYFNGYPVKSSTHFSMETDGLNAVLSINRVTIGTGRLSLKIEGTGMSDDIVLLPGMVGYL